MTRGPTRNGGPNASMRAKVGGWTKTRPVSLGLLPSGPDPVGERYVLRQPPAAYVDHRGSARKGRKGMRIFPAVRSRTTREYLLSAKKSRLAVLAPFSSDKFSSTQGLSLGPIVAGSPWLKSIVSSLSPGSSTARIHRLVGLGPGMRLDVDVLAVEQLRRAVDGQIARPCRRPCSRHSSVYPDSLRHICW